MSAHQQRGRSQRGRSCCRSAECRCTVCPVPSRQKPQASHAEILGGLPRQIRGPAFAPRNRCARGCRTADWADWAVARPAGRSRRNPIPMGIGGSPNNRSMGRAALPSPGRRPGKLRCLRRGTWIRSSTVVVTVVEERAAAATAAVTVAAARVAAKVAAVAAWLAASRRARGPSGTSTLRTSPPSSARDPTRAPRPPQSPTTRRESQHRG